MFGKFSVNFRQTVVDSYLNKNLTTLVPRFLQVYFSKHSKILMVTEAEVQLYAFLSSGTALEGPRNYQSNCEFISNYTVQAGIY